MRVAELDATQIAQADRQNIELSLLDKRQQKGQRTIE